MPNRGKIALVMAGGEIGMRYSERKNGHTPEVTAEEMLQWLPPEIAEEIHLVDWSHQASSHYSIRMTSDLMDILNKLVIDGIQGIVITCGTDTIEEMAYLADLMWAYPQPVIFTGATYPSDVIGTDSSVNLYQALLSARSQACWGAGVLVCIQDCIFAASEITQESNYRRSGFVALDRGPVGEIIGEDVMLRRAPKRGKIIESVTPAKGVELIQASLGGGERLLAALTMSSDNLPDGVVLAAFGNGNIFPGWIPSVKALVRSSVPVLLTSRCSAGRVVDRYCFEGSASRLFEMGVLNGGDLSPEKARLKLSVAIGAGLSGADLQDYIFCQR
ncbi:MAG: asparaginase [Synergistota bacterium]|nr:asparaginase [Synergistota bacterium]